MVSISLSDNVLLKEAGGMRAIERGVVTGTRKNLHPGKVVLTFALGSETLYDFLDNNPRITSYNVCYTKLSRRK